MNELKQILEHSETVKPYGKLNGKDVYTFENAVAKGNQAKIEEKVRGHKNLGAIQRTPREGGLSYTSIHAPRVAINPAYVFNNRMRRVETITEDEKTEVTYEVIMDTMSLMEFDKGNVSSDNILTYVIGSKNVGRGKEYYVKEKKTTSAHDFLNLFKDKLSANAMVKILDAISKDTTAEAGEKELEF